MKKAFYMDDVRNIFSQLKGEEISMSKALEVLNEKAEVYSGSKDGYKLVDTSEKCPFCGEPDFDKVGLKYHLQWHCKEYSDIPTI